MGSSASESVTKAIVCPSGVPAQGVLLDYAGCRSHWSDQGETTTVNFRKLLEMVKQGK